MKVIATAVGYYGLLRRRPGDVFVISDEKFTEKESPARAGQVKAFSSTWMRQVAENTPVTRPSKTTKFSRAAEIERADAAQRAIAAATPPKELQFNTTEQPPAGQPGQDAGAAGQPAAEEETPI